MSRISKHPVPVPKGVEVKLSGQQVSVKGPKGQLETLVHEAVQVSETENGLQFGPRNGDQRAKALAATMRSIVNNMVTGVSEGFESKLELQGVGYRAQAQGSKLNLTLGFSHPVEYELPKGVTVETPTQTEIVVKGADKQLVGQVSAEIRAFRPPEPYKGKGVRYAGERGRRKEAKKK
jgi:large subunit ribosomal protein L6